MWCLKKLLEWVAHGAPITGETLKKIVGHVVFASLFRRPLLSVLRATYSFIRDSRVEKVSAWPPLRYEMWMAASLLPLASANLFANWFPRVACIDAAPNGMGGCFKTLAPEWCEEVGKWEERWRYRRLNPAEWCPRRPSLRELDVVTDPRIVAFLEDVSPDTDLVSREGFPEVPERLLTADDWTESFSRPLVYDEHIGIKEGRAFLYQLREDVMTVGMHGHRVLYLLDNFGVVLFLPKGRACSHGLLQICRKAAAL